MKAAQVFYTRLKLFTIAKLNLLALLDINLISLL